MVGVRQSSPHKRKRNSRGKAVDEASAAKKAKVSHAPQKEFSASSSTAESGKATTQNKMSKGKTPNQRGHPLSSEVAPKANGAKVIYQSTRNAKSEDSSTRQYSAAWQISEPVGGQFLIAQPQITADEKYLIHATSQSVKIYSVESSLLIRTLRDEQDGSMLDISAFTLSVSTPENVYIGFSNGKVELWNWMQGIRLKQWRTPSGVQALAVGGAEGSNETFFTLTRDTNSVILKHQSDSSETGLSSTTVVKTEPLLRGFQIHDRGRVVLAYADRLLMLGNAETLLDDPTYLKYTFRSLEPPESVTFVDARLGKSSSSASKATVKKAKRIPESHDQALPSLNLAVGNKNGEIYVYEDILNQIKVVEQNLAATSPASQKLHWHRKPVTSVVWSADGNYLISGSAEGVLVHWQLDTGKRHTLPGLGSGVEAIQLSPRGVLYSILLADNSIAVLSTSELKAKAFVSSVQCRTPRTNLDTARIGHKQQKLNAGIVRVPHVTLVTKPSKSSHIIIAVPDSQPSSDPDLIAPRVSCLQTFDIFDECHVSRQKLTRDFALTTNIGPDGNKLLSPDIEFLQISSDGQWLASVESWVPPTSDFEPLTNTRAAARQRQGLRREVVLKIWQWRKRQWIIACIFESPHPLLDSRSAGKIFDLSTDPSGPGFVTVGQDGYVRIWKPKRRTVSGVPLKDKEGNVILTWTSEYTTPVEREFATTDYDSDDLYVPDSNMPVSAHLSWSSDGSTIAVCCQTQTHSSHFLQLINANDGSVRFSCPLPVRGPLTGLAFCGRHLISLADNLSVLDVITDTVVHEVEFTQQNKHLGAQNYLAVNQHDDTYAVVLHGIRPLEQEGRGTCATQILIFSTSGASPVFSTELDVPVSGIVSVRSGSGFIVLDAEAQIRTLRPRAGVARIISDSKALSSEDAESIDSAGTDPTAGADNQDANSESLSESSGDVSDGDSDSDDNAATEEEEDDDDEEADNDDGDIYSDSDTDVDERPVVQPQQLAEALGGEGAGGSRLPVTEMFWNVMNLYTGKTGRGGRV